MCNWMYELRVHEYSGLRNVDPFHDLTIRSTIHAFMIIVILLSFGMIFVERKWKMRRSNHLNNILKESHFETFTHVLTPTPPTPVSTLILAPRMVEVSKIKNIMQKVLKEHCEISTSMGMRQRL